MAHATPEWRLRRTRIFNKFETDGKPTMTGTDLTTGGTYKFETAYGTDPTADGYAMVKSTLKSVGDPEAAVTADYAVANKFNISSKGTDLTNLKVSGATILTSDTISGAASDAGNSHLDDALRVLVVQGNNWVLCDKNGVISDSAGHSGADLGKFGNGVTVTHDADTLVTMYVFYDGNDAEIYSNNLPSLEAISSRITVTFTADPQNS